MYGPSPLQMLKFIAVAIQTLFIFQAILTIEQQQRLLSGYFPPIPDLATSRLKLWLEKGVKKTNRFTAGKKRFIKLFFKKLGLLYSRVHILISFIRANLMLSILC